jgi:hypothetical protein
MSVLLLRPPHRVVALVSAMAVLALAGCGGSGSSGSTSPTPPKISSVKVVDDHVQLEYEAPGEWEALVMSFIETQNGSTPITEALRPVAEKGEMTIAAGKVIPGSRIKVFGSVLGYEGERLYTNEVDLTAP